jgi:arylsulfatase A-like enzyme
VKTPNLDRLAAEGGMVMMNDHAPTTVCCPSRSALLTGVHAHKTGVYGNKNNLKNAPKAKDLVTLPEYAGIKARLKALVPQTEEPKSPQNPDLTKQKDTAQ